MFCGSNQHGTKQEKSADYVAILQKCDCYQNKIFSFSFICRMEKVIKHIKNLVNVCIISWYVAVNTKREKKNSTEYFSRLVKLYNNGNSFVNRSFS
jgi:hypothetical protein